MKKATITQTRSRIGASPRQRRTLDALGLTRRGKKIEKYVNDSVRGMIVKVSHLIEVQYHD